MISVQDAEKYWVFEKMHAMDNTLVLSCLSKDEHCSGGSMDVHFDKQVQIGEFTWSGSDEMECIARLWVDCAHYHERFDSYDRGQDTENDELKADVRLLTTTIYESNHNLDVSTVLHEMFAIADRAEKGEYNS